MIKKHIPNFITSLNLLCGSAAIVLALNDELTKAVLLILLAAVFDFLDGMTARLLKAYSPIGKELDSLADVISFGLAPGILMYRLLEISLFRNYFLPDIERHISNTQLLIEGCAFLIPVFSALRLAKFNIDERQTSSFIGLPTPANALFVASLTLLIEHGTAPVLDNFLTSTPFLLTVTVLFSYLLVSELPMFSLKFKSLSWQSNQTQYIFVACAVVLLASLRFYGLVAIIPLYLLMSVVLAVMKRTK